MADLQKAYEAKTIDAKWYQFWEGRGYFKADPHSPKPAYCIVIPPPNVTGVLHMGHALVNTLQDILIRWKRMLGFETLWVPGTDHAGIATQMVVERHLIKTQGKKRKDFSREEFLEHVWTWKEKSETRIIEQLKRLGSSCDWSRLRFTMDENNSRAVRTMFKKLFDAGLIYRGDYLVNWDPVTQTALADDEVEYEEKQSFLWHFKYPLADGSGFIHIATTRPETMLGDTAVAVSPNDERYTGLVGKQVMLPLMNRPISIIADHHVDPAFGTGMVKITPAHDPNDYQMGLNHHLPFINIMTPDGKINANGGQFEGMSMAEAREAVIESMKELGLLEKVEPHVNRIGVSYRSKAIIEPYLSKQWFVRMDGFAKKLREIVQNGEVKLIPSHWENTYFHWIDNLRDWCISRQLWWGHRIPIWYHKDDPTRLICHDSLDLPEEVKQAPDEWIQDTDVLDTWFSSALWPFATLGWPEKTPELEKFYPNSVLVTGHDILFFWVARMILMGDYAMDKPPFPETFLHGLIYGKSYWRQHSDGGILYASEQERLDYDLGKPIPKDVFSKWEKMSKSKGNIIDPLEMIDQYGTDAVRMALCASATQARQIDLDRRRFEEFKNFANKIWNGARFVLMNLDGDEQQGTLPLTAEAFSQGLDESLFSLEDRWILSTLNRTVKSVNHHLQHYQFDQAATEAYDFFWKEFCAYYVEIVKPVLFGKTGSAQERINKQKLLVIVLCQAIRLIHPMAPFITEELFHILKERLAGLEEVEESDPYTKECIQALQSTACLVAPYPRVIRPEDSNEQIDQTFALMEQMVYTIRNIRGEMKLSPGVATDVYIIGQSDDPEWQTVKENTALIAALVRTQRIEVQSQESPIGFACTGVFHALKIQLPLPEEMLKQEKVRLSKEQEKLQASLEKLKTQLANPDFVNRAPAQLIEKLQQQVSQGEVELQEIKHKLSTLP
ncbi:valyl-tRNA synthetase [Candidatus Protochlamydia naegleriophila]|uniref:Valine--tRNA ligase n=1 Tax=Candidatus Protochlamydia naegleriophila TaxID=389348 RepID=A0A0U5CQS9_9BACT|nr:valine--tRNA ligase [Candidatus Protochlamydia naegleriophila]CUI17244.1 valyl-tRNA synthetase [Candidatus Protochlamydia naegleriophila]